MVRKNLIKNVWKISNFLVARDDFLVEIENSCVSSVDWL